MSDIEKELADLDIGQGVAKPATTEAKPEAEDDVEYVIREDGPDGDDDGDDRDERLSSEQREDERGSIREARRKERREKRERQKAARDASRYTIDLLTKRLQEAEARINSFEGRQVSRESQEIDARLGMTQQAYNLAERARRHAVANSDMAAYDAAMRDMQAAEATYNQLRGVKARISQVAQPAQQEDAPDPRVVGMAQEFADRNDWYDPDGSDEDSAIVQTIDRRLAAEGLDPSDEAYWEELDKRIRKRLPHRFEKSKPQTQRQSGPPVGGGREYAPPSTRKEVYVSPERKAAMVAAGAWDNPEKRKSMLRAYAEYDRQNPQR